MNALSLVFPSDLAIYCMKSPLALAFLLTFGTRLHAGVTYIDATLANTDIATGGSDTLWADGNDGSTGGTVSDGTANNDGKWRFRSGYGNGGIWEATGSSATAEDCVELVTTVAVPNESYDVYVFYYMVNLNGDFPVRAGLEPAPNANSIFNRGNAQDASTLTYDAAPPTGSESRTLLYGLVGQLEVTDGTLEIFIDDLPGSTTGSSTDRTWFAGIGYEIAAPPPPPPVPDQIDGTLVSIDPDAG